MLKQLLLVFLLLSATLLADDARLNHYANAMEWAKDADTNADSAYNLGLTYQIKIKDYQKAIYWYKKAYSLDKSTDVVNNLGSAYKSTGNYKEAIKWYKVAIKNGDGDSNFNLALLYEDKLNDNQNAIKYYKNATSFGHSSAAFNLGLLYENNLKDYPNAIKYYEKAYEMGEMGGAFNLALLYRDTLKQPDKAIEWYKKGAQQGDISSTKGAAYFYYNKGDKVTAGAYFIALINVKYPKTKVLNFLKTKWHLTDEELEKAYQLQLQLNIPKHYTGGVN